MPFFVGECHYGQAVLQWPVGLPQCLGALDGRDHAKRAVEDPALRHGIQMRSGEQRRLAPSRPLADQIAELVDAGVQPGLTHHLRGSLDGLNVGRSEWQPGQAAGRVAADGAELLHPLAKPARRNLNRRHHECSNVPRLRRSSLPGGMEVCPVAFREIMVSYTAVDDRVHAAVLHELLLGRTPTVEQLARVTGLPAIAVDDAMERLRERGAVVGGQTGGVVAAYPLSGVPTSQAARLAVSNFHHVIEVYQRFGPRSE